jgi:hypothetical protein
MEATQTNEAAVTYQQWAKLSRRLLGSLMDSLNAKAVGAVENFIDYASADFEQVQQGAIRREREREREREKRPT